MIVADASLLAHSLIPGLDKDSADAVRRLDADWRVPGLWRYELRNVLLKYIRAGALPEETAKNLMAHVFNVMNAAEQDAPSDAVISAAMKFTITSYDAEYIALAEALDVPLITFDKKLVRAAAGLAFLPGDFISQS